MCGVIVLLIILSRPSNLRTHKCVCVCVRVWQVQGKYNCNYRAQPKSTQHILWPRVANYLHCFSISLFLTSRPAAQQVSLEGAKETEREIAPQPFCFDKQRQQQQQQQQETITSFRHLTLVKFNMHFIATPNFKRPHYQLSTLTASSRPRRRPYFQPPSPTFHAKFDTHLVTHTHSKQNAEVAVARSRSSR